MLLFSRKTFIVLIAACFLSLGSCGYRFSGEDAKITGLGALPEGIDRIYVETFEDRTRMAGVDRQVVNALIDHLIRSGAATLTDAESAQAVLSGSVDAVGLDTISETVDYVPKERRIRLAVSMALVRKDGETVGRIQGLTDSETYDVIAGDPYGTELNKRAALDDLSERLAEEAVFRLTRGH